MTMYDHVGGRKLPSYLQIEIAKRASLDGSVSKVVRFHSRIHKRKVVELTFCFSEEFTDGEILMDRDVETSAVSLYGV